MSKMSDVDIKFKEIETEIETLQRVCHALYDTIIQLVTAIGDSAHDRSFTDERLMHIMGAMHEGLVPHDRNETAEEDNVVPLFNGEEE